MYLAFEMRILFYNRRTFLNKAFTGWTRYRMQRKVPSQLAHELIPSFPAGCKRVLLSNNFLESLHRSNVELITERIDQFTASGIKTNSRSVPLDAIVMATGFETHRFLYPIEVTGKEESSLTQRWKQRPQTYLGMLVPDFPNFCMLYGPNTNLGHNSVIFMVECQVNYLVKLIKLTEASKADCFEVTPQATTDFDNQLQQQLSKKVWNGYAKNWYTNEQGYITNNWCRSTLAYMWQTRRVKKSALRFSSRPCTKTADATPNVC
jgi:cation diffusion facilitator CzcD-associated flavoprotein CzcO